MSPGTPSPADVVIVGAGPVGLLQALLLGREGWRVEVLERHRRPYDLPRAVHLDHESARVLQNAGVMHHLAPRTEVMDSYLWRNAAGDPLLWLDGRADQPTASGWPASLMFFQPDLERILVDAIDALPNVTVHRGCEVDSVVGGDAAVGLDDARFVRVGALGSDGRAISLEASWVVGCDGAASRVRSLAGVTVEDLGYRRTLLVADVRPASPTRWSPLNVQVCDPARPTTAVSGGPGRRRFEFLRLPDDPPDGPGLIWGLLARWGLTPDNAVLERHADYTFGSVVVDDWRRGRVFLAGDAAHQMPPFAGQGLCAGIRDAANLAWKLHLVLAGQASVDLLDTYGSERAPQVRAEVDFSVELGELLCVLDPDEAAARDESLRAVGASGPQPLPDRPPLGPGIWHPDCPYGVAALQASVIAGGRRVLLDDVTGGGWRLLRAGGPNATLPGELAGWWASIGGRCESIGPGGTLGDPDGACGRWFESLAADTVLVRPDGYLYGAAAGTNAATDLATTLRQHFGDR